MAKKIQKSKCKGHIPPCPALCTTVKKSARAKAHCRLKEPRQLRIWRQAANEIGYLKKGQFKKLPKKGTDDYERIRSRYLMLNY